MEGVTGVMAWLDHMPWGPWRGPEPSEHVPFFPIVRLAENNKRLISENPIARPRAMSAPSVDAGPSTRPATAQTARG